MNLSQKIPLIHHSIKDLTQRSSFARKARMLLKVKEIERLVRLSPLLSTPTCHSTPSAKLPERGRWGLKSKSSLVPLGGNLTWKSFLLCPPARVPVSRLASVPSQLISLQQPPLPLLGKEGSQTTNSPPLLRRGPGGGGLSCPPGPINS